jgi:hypothetical protein
MTRPWCGKCGGSCVKHDEHFGYGDHFPAIQRECAYCGVPCTADDYTGEPMCEDCQDDMGDNGDDGSVL